MKTILATAIALAASFATAVEIDGLAATVGPATILKSEVYAEMRRAGIQDDSRYEEILARLVERSLMLKAAADAKMTLQEWVVDDRIRTIIDDAFGGDRNKLVESLAREKTTYADWRKRIKDDMIVGAMRWNTVDKNVIASPSALLAEYKAHPERYRSEPRMTVAVILLKPEDRAKRPEVNGTIESKGFAEAARTYSADSRAKDGGVWKDVRPEEVFNPAVCAEIARIDEGKISRWIDLDGWSFLVKKISGSASKPRTFAEAYDDIAAAVKEAEAKRLYNEWMERLKAGTYIHIW